MCIKCESCHQTVITFRNFIDNKNHWKSFAQTFSLHFPCFLPCDGPSPSPPPQLNLTELNSSNSPVLLSVCLYWICLCFIVSPSLSRIYDIIPVECLFLLWPSLLSPISSFTSTSFTIGRFGCLSIAIPTRSGISSRKYFRWLVGGWKGEIEPSLWKAQSEIEL